MYRGSSSYRELKVILYTLQIRCMANEVSSIHRISDSIDPTQKPAILVLVANFFSSIHCTPSYMSHDIDTITLQPTTHRAQQHWGAVGNRDNWLVVAGVGANAVRR